MSTLQGPGQSWDHQPWQKPVDRLDGSEPDGAVVPPWLSSVLCTGRLPACKDSKVGFFLMPAQVALSPLSCNGIQE